ncbi:hypothetical protein HMPREF9237_01045 [Actinotignum schaalii FB123-CNA-2]|uniref:Uncharacterized protein n=1 Tax=Actinotignum schaalii FB123-CNA-2 TaxID=883067 RepID=S2W3D8_9ACTO|nr:hypothetical protein HMPREF9237_01045 [Actinotignum schaalii FB123-CNA-2]
MFFRDVLRMYDKRSTALKTHTTPADAGVTIEACEAHGVLEGSRGIHPKSKRNGNYVKKLS